MANGTLAVSQINMLSQSGTGIITITPPATNTNRTLTLPNSTGTVLDSTGGTTQTALTVTNGASIQGLTVGRGAGAVADNTAVGVTALQANTTGSGVTAAGNLAGYSNTTGSSNSVFGDRALAFNTTGGSNTAIGAQALNANTTASNNTAVGYQAGYNNTTGASNTFIGQTAGHSTTGGGNTFVGATVGSVGAGYFVTTGTKNTIIGGFHGNQDSLDIRTASNNIVLSDGDGNVPLYFEGSSGKRPWFRYSGSNRAIVNNTDASTPFGLFAYYTGAAPNGTSNEFFICNDTAVTRASIRSNGGIANFSANNVNLSDRREKTNFAPAKSYLDVICAIPVQTFNYIDQNMEDDGGLTLGVVAQDVQAVAPEMVMESNWAKDGDEPKMRLSIYQTDLQYALMKCIQELKAEFDAYKATHP